MPGLLGIEELDRAERGVDRTRPARQRPGLRRRVREQVAGADEAEEVREEFYPQITQMSTD